MTGLPRSLLLTLLLLGGIVGFLCLERVAPRGSVPLPARPTEGGPLVRAVVGPRVSPIVRWSTVALPPGEVGRGDVEAGRGHFQTYCAACHGPNGAGDGELARHLVKQPRNLLTEPLRYRTAPADGPAAPADVYRSITAGFPGYGMPGFAHLAPSVRRDLVAWVLHQQGKGEGHPLDPDRLAPPTTSTTSLSQAEHLWASQGCAGCHGETAAGDGPLAGVMAGAGFRIPDLTAGPSAFHTGWEPEDVYRVLTLGVPGTPMPALADQLTRGERWALARYVVRLARTGFARRQAAFEAVLVGLPPDAQRALHPWTAVAAFQPGAGAGCLSCHQGIEPINDAMGPALDALSGYRPGHRCVLCHEGDTAGRTVETAHLGLIPDPGSLWAVSLGLGCARCHSAPDRLTTLRGAPLPAAVGGAWMAVRSHLNDPTGSTGADHVYRTLRSLMALETGKANHTMISGGLAPHGVFRYANFPVQDPDGPVPLAGTPAYQAWVSGARAHGSLEAHSGYEGVPTWDAVMAHTRDEQQAFFADYYRKDCGRCHLWTRGRPLESEFRAAGCSACHVPYADDGRYRGGDPTLGPTAQGRPLQHRIPSRIPNWQCFRCHQSNRDAQVPPGELGSYRILHQLEPGAPIVKADLEVHLRRGMLCTDCHDSVDVHGDGNLYPTLQHQLTVRCQDCHGTPDRYPWELPVGHGHGFHLEGRRGTWEGSDGQHYLRNSKGNVQGRWHLVEGNQVWVVDGERRHQAVLLKDRGLTGSCWQPKGPFDGSQTTEAIGRQHLEKLDCAACHSTKTQRCDRCHINYDRQGVGVDWLAGGLDAPPTPGRMEGWLTRDLRWAAPQVRTNLHGQPSAFVVPCEYWVEYRDDDGERARWVFGEGLPSPLQTGAPHDFTLRALTCIECHPQ